MGKRKRLPRWTPGARRFVRALGERLAARSAAAAAGGDAYRAHRARVGEAQAARTRAGQEIGPIPPRADPKRHDRCRQDLRAFLETYFPGTFHLAWSADHLKVIAKIERAVLAGGLFAFAMPRGAGKTSLAWASSLWASLYGHRRYTVILAVSAERATELMETVKRALTANQSLLADFPAETAALVALENEPRRCLGQRYQGQPTHVRWQKRRIVFASIGEHARYPPIVSATGLTGGGVRGQQYLEPTGEEVVRPDLVLVDDPQDDEVAASPTQVRKRLRLLNGAVLGMAGPGRKIAALAAVTVIQPDDVASGLLDREISPDWQGVRVPLLYALPTDYLEHKGLWEEYRRLRLADLEDGTDEAGAAYLARRAEMDAGAKPFWKAWQDEGEHSAVQHAMNLLFRDEATFYAEYQNEPQLEDLPGAAHLRAADVAARTSGRARGEVPLAATKVTAFIDLGDEIFFWCVSAWEEDFTGHVIDYQAWPEQKTQEFSARNPPRTLGRAYPGRGVDGAMQAGLKDLVDHLVSREWPRAGGAGVARIDRLLIDAGHKPKIPAAVTHLVPGPITLSKGVGITAGRKPIHAYKKKPGEVHGHEWYFPTVKGTQEFPHILYDTNWWKSFVAQALATAPGDPGAVTLFGKAPNGRPLSAAAHRLFAAHVGGAEYWVETEGYGRTVREWKERPAKPDNHWWDCLVGCAVAASLEGVQVPGADAGRGGGRRRYSRGALSRGRGR